MIPFTPSIAAAILQPVPSRASVLLLEEELKKLPQVEMPPAHHFAHGMYAREIFIPKDTVLVGKIHRFEHLNFIMKGDISVMTEHGLKRVVGPCVLKSSPGIKRAGYTHEDTIWITVHANPDDETDMEVLEKRYIAKDFGEIGESPTDDQIRALIGG